MEWINVKNELPEKQGRYLVWHNNMILKAVYMGNDYFSYGYYSNRILPTHWMPLPEPPKGE